MASDKPPNVDPLLLRRGRADRTLMQTIVRQLGWFDPFRSEAIIWSAPLEEAERKRSIAKTVDIKIHLQSS